MEGGCEGRKSGIDSNNNVWAIYNKMGIMLIRWCGKVGRQSKSGVVKIGIEGAIAKVGVTRGDSNYNCIIVSISVSGIEWRR